MPAYKGTKSLGKTPQVYRDLRHKKTYGSDFSILPGQTVSPERRAFRDKAESYSAKAQDAKAADNKIQAYRAKKK